MSKSLHIGCSPLTNHIFAGRILKDNQTWEKGKQDVTNMVCGAVAEYATLNGGTIVVDCNGKPKFEITVRRLEEK